MIKTKIITNWTLLIIGIILLTIIENDALELLIVLIFGGITLENRKEINKYHKEQFGIGYFYRLGNVTQFLIILYFVIVTPAMLWLAFNQPGTIDALFSSGKAGVFMLLGVLSPLLIPMLASVIYEDIELIKNEK